MSDTITKFEELARQAKLEEIRMEDWRANEEAIERRKRIIDQNGNSGIHYVNESADTSRTFSANKSKVSDYPESNVKTSDLDITDGSNTSDVNLNTQSQP